MFFFKFEYEAVLPTMVDGFYKSLWKSLWEMFLKMQLYHLLELREYILYIKGTKQIQDLVNL